MDLTSKIAALQDYREYEELNWNGSFEEYLEIVRENPQVTRNAFQRVYDMIISYGQEEYIDNKKKLIRYNFFKDEQHGGRDAIFGLDIPLMRLVHVLQVGGAGLRPREARHPPARAGRLVEVDDRAPAQEGLEEYSRTPEGALYTFEWDMPKELAAHHRRARGVRVADARRAAAPHPAEWREQGVRGARARQRAVPDPRRGRSESGVPVHLPRADAALRGRLVEGDQPHARQAPHPVGEGSRRYRHVPAEGREEPGLDRAHRRHQLPQDRRVRLGLRSARVQLRRRVQHRQPRHRRVHRGAQARRRVPLRPARRVAGAQDQAEEVRADRHRRGHPRPHQRGRIQEAPEQRVHGGACAIARSRSTSRTSRGSTKR